MCQICDNDYEGLNNLYIDGCKKVMQIPHMQRLIQLYIRDCIELLQISNIQRVNSLKIYNCPKVAHIPHIQGLNELHIMDCPQVVQIPNIQGLIILNIVKCSKLTQIPNIKGLNYLYVRDCKYFKDINADDKLKISRYLNEYKLHNWLKRMLFLRSARYKALWRIAEHYTKKKYSPDNALKYLNLDD